MSALSDALRSAQAQAITALSRGYLSGALSDDELLDALERIGCTDVTDQGYLRNTLETLKAWGAQLPSNGAAKPSPDNEPASEAQKALIRRLADEKGQVAPDVALSKAKASEVITALQKGTYSADVYTVPF